MEPADCVLLGAVVGKRAVSAQLAKRERGLRALAGRFAEIDRHDSLALLRLSLSHPRAVYELRAGAGFRDTAALAAYDAALRDVLEGALNVAFDERSWGQCVLPPVLSGLGIRAPSDLALPAYLSSAAASETLAASVALGVPDELSVEARASWAQATGLAQPEGPESHSRSLQGPLDHARHKRLVDGLSFPGTSRECALPPHRSPPLCSEGYQTAVRAHD